MSADTADRKAPLFRNIRELRRPGLTMMIFHFDCRRIIYSGEVGAAIGVCLSRCLLEAGSERHSI